MSSNPSDYYWSQLSQNQSQSSEVIVNSLLPTIMEQSSQNSKSNESMSVEEELKIREQESEKLMNENFDFNGMDDELYDPDDGNKKYCYYF